MLFKNQSCVKYSFWVTPEIPILKILVCFISGDLKWNSRDDILHEESFQEGFSDIIETRKLSSYFFRNVSFLYEASSLIFFSGIL